MVDVHRFGARDVRILEGGFPAWTAAGYPVEQGEQRPRPARSFSRPAERRRRGRPGRGPPRAGRATAQVVDARSAERFRGEAPEPRPGLRSGHLPGSHNLPYGEVVREGRLADPETISAAVRAAGIDPTGR